MGRLRWVHRLAIEPRRIRALRVGAEAARERRRFAAMLALADETAINAFVFDTKQEGERSSTRPGDRGTTPAPW